MFDRLLALARGLRDNSRAKTELDEELEFHVEMETRANVERGMPHAEARRRALADFGGVTQTKESVFDVRATLFDGPLQDVRFAWRMLARSPGYTTAAVLTLALGIGANAAVFSLIDSLLLHPLAVAEPDRLMTVSKHYPQYRLATRGFLYAEVERFRQLHSFSGIAAEGGRIVGLGGGDGTRAVSVVFVSPDYFHLLGVRPQAGRWFLPEEERQGSPPVVVLTDNAWRSWFNADPSIVGKVLRLTGVAATVVGVAPRNFKGVDLAAPPDVFAPLLSAPLIAATKENFFGNTVVTTDDGAFSPMSWLRVTGRLRPGVTPEAAERELSVLAARASKEGGSEQRFSLVPSVAAAIPDRFRSGNISLAWLLGGIVIVVLLVGCAGLAGLVLARTEKRRRELATRAALGASRGRLVWQLVAEIGILALAGVATSLLVARTMLSALSAFALPGVSLERLAASIDLRVLTFAACAGVVTAVVFGVFPVWRASRSLDVAASLTSQGRSTRRGRSLLQPAALAFEVALTVVLLVAAGLFVRSVRAGFAADVGFRPDHLVIVELNQGLRRYSGEESRGMVDRVINRLQATPGVRSVSIGPVPFRPPHLGGRSLGADGQRREVAAGVQIAVVERNYFGTLGIPLTRGRGFEKSDSAASAPVAIVSETLARVLWSGGNAIGRLVTNLPMSGPGIVTEAQVVGVAKDVRGSLADDGAPGILYLLRVHNPAFDRMVATVAARVTGDTGSAVALLRAQVARVDRDLPVAAISTMEEQIATALMTPRLGSSLTRWFSLLAIALAVTGTYGLVAYAVARRTSEIGVRIALGASPAEIPFLMMRRGLVPVVVGVVLGMAAAWPVARLIRGFLFGVPPDDPVSFVGAPLLLLGAAGMAGYLAARRAAHIDPIRALRAE